MSLTRVCVRVSETGELAGAIILLLFAIGGAAASIRILRKWRLPIDPMFPERGPIARLLAGAIFLSVACAVGGVALWGLLHPC